MKEIRCFFSSEGKAIKKTARLSNDLQKLSMSARNQATDLIDFEDEWSIIFEQESDSTNTMFEVVFKIRDGQRTTTIDRAITWGGRDNDAIIDVQKATCIIRNY